MVGGTGFEPVTPSLSTKCSTPELTAHAAIPLWAPRCRRVKRGLPRQSLADALPECTGYGDLERPSWQHLLCRRSELHGLHSLLCRNDGHWARCVTQCHSSKGPIEKGSMPGPRPPAFSQPMHGSNLRTAPANEPGPLGGGVMGSWQAPRREPGPLSALVCVDPSKAANPRNRPGHEMAPLGLRVPK